MSDQNPPPSTDHETPHPATFVPDTRSDPFDQAISPHDPPTLTDAIAPDTFPGFDLLEVLGKGGMGIVYKARQTSLNRLVALKAVLGGERADGKELIRFLAEAEAVASIRHPHVVQVYEYGESAGRPFLVMEYLAGGSLSDRLKPGKLDPGLAAGLVAKLAHAVEAAHQQDIVHRDLKPANILFDAQGEPKVADFGIAKRTKASDLTQTQVVMGTPAYMSPEQAGGQSKFVGPPADVYALGVILYECLTGSPPFQHAELHALLYRVATEPPERPSRRAPGLPRDLELITLKCLEKDPLERYPTAGALAAELGRYTRGETVTVRAAGPVEKSLKWARRKPTLAAAYVLTATVALLLIFGSSLAVLWQKAEVARGKAEQSRETAEIAQKNAETARQAEASQRLIAESARKDEQQARTIAETARDAEKKARADVEAAREKLAAVEYGRTMQFAHQEWRDNNVLGSQALLAGTREDQRGWEWRYLNRLWHGERLELKGHTFYVTSVAWSPDGSKLATVGEDKTVRVWDARTGAEVLNLKGHTDSVTTVAWSPDGSKLATASRDKTARVWDARSGAEVLTLKGHTSSVTSVAWSPDGSKLATVGEDKTVRVWDARTGAEVLNLKGHTSSVDTVAWSPDGFKLATANGDNTVRVWDAKTGAEVLTLKGHTASVTLVAWSPDGTRLATASSDKTARVWDCRSGAELEAAGY